MCTHYSEGDNLTFLTDSKKKTADVSPAPPNLWLLVREFLKQSVLKTPALEYNMLSSWYPQAVCKTSVIQTQRHVTSPDASVQISGLHKILEYDTKLEVPSITTDLENIKASDLKKIECFHILDRVN